MWDAKTFGRSETLANIARGRVTYRNSLQLLFIKVMYFLRRDIIPFGSLLLRTAMTLLPMLFYCVIDDSDLYRLLGKLLILRAAKEDSFSIREGILLLGSDDREILDPSICVYLYFPLACRPILRGILSMLLRV